MSHLPLPFLFARDRLRDYRRVWLIILLNGRPLISRLARSCKCAFTGSSNISVLPRDTALSFMLRAALVVSQKRIWRRFALGAGLNGLPMRMGLTAQSWSRARGQKRGCAITRSPIIASISLTGFSPVKAIAPNSARSTQDGLWSGTKISL